METTEVKPSESSKPSEAKCACVCHKMFGIFILIAGIVGLLGVLSVLSHTAAGIAVSILAILAGLQTMMRGRCKCCNAA